MAKALRWGIAAAVLIAAFFATWVFCDALWHAMGRDVALSLAGLATAVASLPMGAWAAREQRSAPEPGKLAIQRAGNVPQPQLIVGEIPRQPPAFQARADLQANLANVRGVAVVTAVTGSRGIGKTHLAAAFARGCIAAGWPVVAWIVAEDSVQALAGMDRLARALGLTAPRDDSATAARKARSWLETQADDRSLLVFDNVPDPDAVRPWLPAAGLTRVIVTSTNTACEDLGTAVRVEVFTPDEAIDFLRQ